ncbi:hypothetical protein DTO212C5_7253 [Paecilomyces variotii]|nr:hypothetical protein DTO212C5_7253 [Paecilomyces variotii]
MSFFSVKPHILCHPGQTMTSIQASLTNIRSRITKLFGSLSHFASLERVNSYPVAEEPDYYKAGGFHPISLGDTLGSGQYTVLRKLGYGQYSTVWLARDYKFVALKVLRADCYGRSHDIFEREILLKILEISGKSSHEGRNYVSGLLDHFKQKGPNGDHVCFVFDVLGHHLDFQAAKYEDGKLPVKAIKLISRQLLLGLDFLHRECGIIHTDLKPTNTYPSRAGTIIDFGVASWREKHLSDLIQSPAMRAPEVAIGAPWDVGVDIWSLGCLIVEFVQGIIPFSGEASRTGSWTAEDDHLARIMEVLGPFPLQFIKRGNRAPHFFDEKGNLRRIPNLKPTSIEHLINGTTKPFLKPRDMPDAEVPVFVDFLRCMLAIDPESRKSAAELLQHEWLNLL